MADEITGDQGKALVPRLLQAGAGAPKLLLESAIGAQLGRGEVREEPATEKFGG